MAPAERVKLQSVLSVVASHPVDPGMRIEVSSRDATAARYAIRAVVYYRSNPFASGPMGTALENLRFSLSDVLDLYPKVTGRLSRRSGGDDGDDDDDRWEVRCNDAGVRVFSADVDASLDEWLASAGTADEEKLSAWEAMPADPRFWPPFRIQMNSFKCGGIALGFSCSHLIGDLTSLALFINSWSELHRRRSPPHFPISFHLSPPPAFSPVKLKSKPPPSPATPPAAKLSTAAIAIPGDAIERRLSQIRRRSPGATPFDFLSALFWSRIVRLQRQEPATGEENHRAALAVLVDVRNRWIPRGYFGNGWLVSAVEVDAGVLLRCSEAAEEVTDLVSKHIKGLKVEEEEEEKGYDEAYESEALTCINLENVIGDSSLYGAAFEDGGSPTHVSCSVWGLNGGGGLIVVGPSPENGGRGRTVNVTLPEEQIDKLCSDEAVLNLEPTVKR